jgi:hypothetical protein
MMEFASWDDEIPNIWKNKSHVPNRHPDIDHIGKFPQVSRISGM